MKPNFAENIIVDCLKIEDVFHYTCTFTQKYIGSGYEFGIVHFNEANLKLYQTYAVLVNASETI